MRLTDFEVFPRDDPDQEIRIKRFFIATGAYAMSVAFAVLCWSIHYLSDRVVAVYLLLVLAINVIVYSVLRSGLNKRFPDPSLTFPQIALGAVSGFYPMYFAGEARGTFLLLGISMFVFGMFRFRTRDFVALAIFMLGGYALLIAILAYGRGGAVNLHVEMLRWIAMFVALAQLSFLGGIIGNLRRKVRKNNLALAQQNTELEAALQRINDMAIHDELTGVYNRRHLMEKIAEEAQRTLRTGSAFYIGILDIDLFKEVNDTYGHLAGDNVLRNVAMTIPRMLRQTDCFGRLGGEEFVMILTDTTAEGARATADRVRQGVERICFPEINGNLRITVSIGIAEHSGSADTATTIKRADEALYRAKQTGRNKCVCAFPLDEMQGLLHAPSAAA